MAREKTIGFVPTMGALHEGHLALVRRSQRENDVTIVSVFVNPTQFRPNEDLSKYPRPWKKDLRLLRREKIAALFSPKPEHMYAPNDDTRIHVERLTTTLCGAPTSRGPEHFVGVATVVAKLFNLVQPTRAYFGLKDFQQVRVIEQMVRDLCYGIRIVRCPIVREPDGLALSSRNIYLTADERSVAPQIYAALQEGRKLLRSQPRMNPALVRRHVRSLLTSIPNAKIDYLELVDPESLQQIHSISGSVLLAVAVKIGSTRLIDNIVVSRS